MGRDTAMDTVDVVLWFQGYKGWAWIECCVDASFDVLNMLGNSIVLVPRRWTMDNEKTERTAALVLKY